MKIILRYLKPFVLSIVAIIALLLTQAFTDLSLPEYMSNIVNVGIQNGGIDKLYPEAIRETELEKIKNILSDEEKLTIEENYTLVEKNSDAKLIEKYSFLKEENIYIINDANSEETKNILEEIFSKNIPIIQYLEKVLSAKNIDISMLSDRDIQGLKDEFSNNSELSDETQAEYITKGYIQKEYSKLGEDTEKIQNNYILKTGAQMLGIAFIGAAATVIVGLIAARTASRLGSNLREDTFKKVISFSNTELDKFSSASLITRSTNDIQQVQNLMVPFLRIVFYSPILAVGGIVKVLRTDASMAWIIAISVLAIITLVIVLFSMAIPRFKKVQILVDKANRIARESLTGMLVARAFNNQKNTEDRFKEANTEWTDNSLAIGRIMTTMMPFMTLIMNTTTIAIVWIAAERIDMGSMQIGNMMAFIQYSMQIIMSFLMISMVSIMLPRATVSANRVGEILDTKLSIVDKDDTEQFNNKGVVEFKDVTFKYKNSDKNALSNIEFVANKGETTAIIGSTGSGKTTLINLIMRFYDVTEGIVEVGGQDVKNLDQKELRDAIGYVPQRNMLFSGTIESNIKYGNKELENKEMDEIAVISQASEFINSNEEKYNTRIAQGGDNISGGQKQRLSIARALAKKTDIYIFDDSFSALDYKTDLQLRTALEKNMKDSTRIIVAQRVNTIKNANKIIVLDNGKIVGMGEHKELLEDCEVYNEIVSSQLSEEELLYE